MMLARSSDRPQAGERQVRRIEVHPQPSLSSEQRRVLARIYADAAESAAHLCLEFGYRPSARLVVVLAEDLLAERPILLGERGDTAACEEEAAIFDSVTMENWREAERLAEAAWRPYRDWWD